MIRVGVMGCSNFAIRAMLPAFQNSTEVALACVASRDAKKAEETAAQFGCEPVEGYSRLLDRTDLDAVYMPLPTGLHAEWARETLAAGKHLLIEKSLACTLESATAIMDAARQRSLLVMENFQFQTHRQWGWIKELIASGELGNVHLIRSTFGFPPLPKENFRWNRELGGGALLDTGAYMAKVSQQLMGRDLDVVASCLAYDQDTGVDLYGEAMLRNSEGQVAQVAYGFDYHYQCRLELLGTKGKFSTGRVFTAPPGFEATMTIEAAGGGRDTVLEPDNAYENMVAWFAEVVASGDYERHWMDGLDQARLIDEMRRLGDGEA